MAEAQKVMGFCDLDDEELMRIVTQAAAAGIAELHAKGIPSTHADEKGVYKLYPDGHKVHLEHSDNTLI